MVRNRWPPATVKGALTAVRSFVRWLREEEYLEADVASALKDRAMLPSKDLVLQLVRSMIAAADIERSCVYWDRRELREGDPVRVGMTSIPMPFAGSVAFVDLAPRANWAHPCLYLLVDADAHEAELVEASFPPYSGTPPASYTIILRYGKEPPHERCFQVFDSR